MAARDDLLSLIAGMEREIRDAFLAAIQDIVDNAILVDVVRAIQAGDIEGAFKALGFNDAALRPISDAIEQSYMRGGVFTGSTFPRYLNTSNGRAVFRFDMRNSRAEEYLRNKSSTLVTQITDDIRQNVRDTVTRGMETGTNPRTVALDIIGKVDRVTGSRTGGVVGLTAGQEGWVQSARNKLVNLDEGYFNMSLRDKRFDRTVEKAIREGKPLPADTVAKLVDRYRSNALRYRGESIARTEALQSIAASEHEAIMQAVDSGAVRKQDVKRGWDAVMDTRTRWSHRRMEGQTVGIDEPFVSPSGARMMFPGDSSLGAPGAETIMCRCRVKTVIDWLAAVE